MDLIALVKKAKKGDKTALVELIMHKKKDYYKLAYVYMKNEDDAMDAIEDMIVILYENIMKLKNDSSFYSWSNTILVNCCKKMLKKKKNIVSLELLPEKPYEVYQQRDSELDLQKYLAKLNFKQQEAIWLRYYLGLDYQTIADILKIPLGTVKSRISTAIKTLSENMGGDRFE